MAHLFVENITHIDCSLLDHKRGLIGASWIVDIELIGDLDEQSMVLDFSKVKRQIKAVIDEHIDHKLLVAKSAQELVIEQQDQQIEIQFTDQQNETIVHRSPPCAITLIEATHINELVIRQHLIKLIQQTLPDHIAEIRLALRQEQNAASYYCYSHGLKKHDGNCQRIAHGHRSKVRVWRNNKRDLQMENELAAQWKDIYLGSRADIAEQKEQRIRFQYRTAQGEFMIDLPKHRVHTMSTDSTVECIAQHIAERLHQQSPNAQIKVQAFEGINKGAFAEISPNPTTASL